MLARDPGRPCPPLDTPARADVCIVGGGYTGLWTRARDPPARARHVRRGGRGGHLRRWRLRAATAASRPRGGTSCPSSCTASASARRSCWRRRRRGRSTRSARSTRAGASPASARPGTSRWRPAAPRSAAGARRSSCSRASGSRQRAEELGGDEIRRRTGCPLALAGVRFRDGATVQPAFYARGLRAAALDAGVRIYEHTPMLALRRDRPALIETPRGSVEADAVMLATQRLARAHPRAAPRDRPGRELHRADRARAGADRPHRLDGRRGARRRAPARALHPRDARRARSRSAAAAVRSGRSAGSRGRWSTIAASSRPSRATSVASSPSSPTCG